MSHDDVFRSLRVGTPCHMKFDDLEGDGATRWCGECRLHVYDFARLTRPEVLRLVETTDGRLCGRIVRRPDGTVMTKDCGPVRQRRHRLGTAAAALLAASAPFGLSACAPGTIDGAGTRAPDPEAPQVDPDPDPNPEFPELLGDVVCDPAELEPAPPPELEHDPRGLLGRIALPPREPETPDGESD